MEGVDEGEVVLLVVGIWLVVSLVGDGDELRNERRQSPLQKGFFQ